MQIQLQLQQIELQLQLYKLIGIGSKASNITDLDANGCNLFQGNFGPYPPDKCLDKALNRPTLWRTKRSF
jgi:hypothetical protein